MSRNGDTIKAADLSTRAAVKATFQKVLSTDRFDTCELVNATKIWFVRPFGLFQGLDESGDSLPSGYVRDTGVTVVGADGIPPGGHSVATVQASIKVYATRVKCSAQISLADGSQDQTYTFLDAVLTPQEIAQGYFIDSVVFTLPGGKGKPKGKTKVRKSQQRKR